LWGAHTGPNPTDRRKKGCKRHLITDANGLPLALTVTPANVVDGQKAIALLDAIPPVAGARGRPRFRPDAYLGDRAYGWQITILHTRQRRVTPQLARPQDDTHGSGLGRFRYVVERTLAWFGNFRRLRFCYEKSGALLQAFHDLAAALICFNKWIAHHAS
jgi:transposase